MATTPTTPTPANSQQVAVQQKNITEQVLAKIETFRQAGELRIPADYSPENALKAAYLVLLETKTGDGKPVLEACTKESIANSLLKMVVWGLSPLKKQCDFIAYGGALKCDPEYTGNILLAKRYGKLIDYKPNAIFKGDVFSFRVLPDGRRQIIEHKQALETFGGEVIGAYMWYKLSDGTEDVEIMNINQIRAAWMQGGSKGNSNAHKNFSDQMAIKTVINRACKLLIRSSGDAPLMGEVSGDESSQEQTSPDARKVISEKANVEEIGFEDVSHAESAEQDNTQKESTLQETAEPIKATNAQTEFPY